jgi:hypothetical protein
MSVTNPRQDCKNLIYCQVKTDNNLPRIAIPVMAPADMLLFVDVVREGSFTAAVRHAGISKQALSERIDRLETALGAGGPGSREARGQVL